MKRRKITAGKLSKILKEHKRWIDDKKEGERADLSKADLSNVKLERAYLSGADLSDTNLSCADLSGTDLSSANLRVANLGVADLRGANLSEANLSEADLYGAFLSNANLSRADLSCAYLSFADLSGTDLSEAELSIADLSNADLNKADLSNANLSGANLIRVRGLTLEQLSSVETLCDAELSAERIKQVRKKYSHLLGEIEPDEEKLSRRRIITLRSSYKTLSVSEVQSMPNVSIRKKKYWGFCGHGTINHDYNLKAIKDDKVVVDNTTGLMWHKCGSDEYIMKWNKAKEWVEDLNSEEGYAGYQDWRLPTLDEAVSLLESSKKNRGLYIDPVFSKKQGWIWTGDKFDNVFEDGSEAAWGVHFQEGTVYRSLHDRYIGSARPVRSVE
jgi:hypothetical protein